MEKHNTINTIKRRSISLLMVFLIFFVAITARLGYIQFSWGSELRDKAIGQWTREIGIYPKRGTIYDANGLVLAVSVSRYSLQATPNNITNPEAVAEALAPILGMTTESIIDRLSNKSQALVWIKRLLSDEQADAIKILQLKGLELVDEPARVYPYNDLAAQVLGFTMKYAEPNGHSGQEGIELFYNDVLIGEPGTILRETDNTGAEIPNGNEIYVDAQNGSNLVLTIDATLQSYLQEQALKCMEKYTAAGVYAIAMNPKTGEIYAMVNIPAYDPNEPPRDWTLEEMQAVTKNMTCQMNYDPGSTFKSFTLAAALEEGVIDYNTNTYYCPGYKIVDGQKVHCSNHSGHGSETVQMGFNNSCNPVFMEIGDALGKDKVYEYIEKFGFGQKTGVDISGEESGIVLDPEIATHRDWNTMCFGQAISVTGIQMITAFNALINGGYMMQPHLLKNITRTVENEDGTQSTEILYTTPITNNGQVISNATSELMRKALVGTVENGGGRSAKVLGYNVGGKTGTAQTYDSSGNISSVEIGSFIGYGPYEDPQISVYFMAYGAKYGTAGSIVAAPFAGDFLEDAFNYLGIEPTKPTQEPGVGTWVANFTGKSLEEAVSQVESYGFEAVLSGTGNFVIAQSVRPNTTLLVGQPIVLTLGYREIDPNQIPVPSLVGMTVLEANKVLMLQNLKMQIAGNGDIVTDQSISPGTYVDPGTTITVFFTKDPENCA